MPLDSTYMLIHRQSFLEQEVENVYFFDHLSGSGFSGDLALAWQAEVLPLVNSIQCGVVQNEGLEVMNLGITTDFSTLTGVGGGGITAESLPPQDALSFTYKSSDRAIRPGGKRISGIPESVQINGEVNDSSYLTAVNSLRVAFGTNIVSADDTWKPVLVKRIRSTVAGTVPPKYRYRLPAVGDPFLSTGIAAVLLSTFVKSQVSRKR